MIVRELSLGSVELAGKMVVDKIIKTTSSRKELNRALNFFA